MNLTEQFSKPIHFALYVKCDPGTSIDDAFQEAVELATRIRCLVRFIFNDVDCAAFPDGDPKSGVAEFLIESALEKQYKFAHARPKKATS